MIRSQQLEIERTIQGFNFFLNKDPKKTMSKMKLLKLLWLVDRYTMRKYGYIFSNDEYCAMKWGSIGSTSKDILDGKRHSPYIDRYIQVISNRSIKSKAPVDSNEFSEIDVTALEKVWAEYGKMTAAKLSDYCHKFPEYLRHKDKIDQMGGSYEEDVDDFFSNPNTKLTVNIFDQDEETLELNKEALEEDAEISAIFS